MPTKIPTYHMYGEYLTSADTEPIHHEPIFKRSSKHDWLIQQHQHEKLVQLFYFQTAGVRIEMLNDHYITSGKCIFFVPIKTAHGFKFPENTEGDVVSLQLDELAPDMLDQIGRFDEGKPVILPEDDTVYFTQISELIAQTRFAYRDISQARNEILSSLLSLVLTYLSAETHSVIQQYASSSDQTLHERQAQAFCDQVEQHFASDYKVGEYAALIGVSAPHLSRISNKILNSSPNELIKQRRIVEAKRLLKFTKRSVGTIARRSGFADIGYFSRSFKKIVGQTPSQYRDSAGL